MTNQLKCANKQSGSVLIEAMVSVVIFSFGLLALISMLMTDEINTGETTR